MAQWEKELAAHFAAHHAHCITGDRQRNAEILQDVLAISLNMTARGNPDLHQLTEDYLTIDAARGIRAAASQRPVAGERRVFILSFARATREAQNALLKLLEDPKEAPLFFILIPSSDALLPTLRSRLAMVSGTRSVAHRENATKFLSADPAERLVHIKPILEEKDRQTAFALLDALEDVLYAHGADKMQSELREVLFCRRYMMDQSVSLKMLLEHLATTLPRTKIS